MVGLGSVIDIKVGGLSLFLSLSLSLSLLSPSALCFLVPAMSHMLKPEMVQQHRRINNTIARLCIFVHGGG